MADSVTDQELIDAALAVRANAYSAYSDFSVGAAVLDEHGRIHIGCNVENAAYPQGNCAETSAIAAMIAAGGRKIVAIAVAGGRDELMPCTPCGGCRQRINEFADDTTRIIVINDDGDWQTYSIAALLPASFHLD
jgi:cytidine deaminase